MIGWSDSLRLELLKVGHRHATTTAWNAMLRGKPLLRMPWTVGLSQAFKGILPVRAWDFLAGRMFKIYSSMDEFTGRS